MANHVMYDRLWLRLPRFDYQFRRERKTALQQKYSFLARYCRQFKIIRRYHLFPFRKKCTINVRSSNIELQHGQISKSQIERVGRSTIGDREALKMLPKQNQPSTRISGY